MNHRGVRAIALATAIMLAVLAGYVVLIRPWHLTWGATDEEVGRRMPGDEIVPHPSFNATRAVTIAASPEQIWPWLVQMGYKRAGFYSHDWLDNDRIPSAEHILAEYQDLAVGDRIPVAESSYVEVRAMEPYRSMLWIFEDGAWSNATWAWGLYRQDTGHTRLVSRLRIRYDWTSPTIAWMLVVDAFELVMMRKCLLGIKHRAERLAAESGYGRRRSWRNRNSSFSRDLLVATAANQSSAQPIPLAAATVDRDRQGSAGAGSGASFADSSAGRRPRTTSRISSSVSTRADSLAFASTASMTRHSSGRPRLSRK